MRKSAVLGVLRGTGRFYPRSVRHPTLLHRGERHPKEARRRARRVGLQQRDPPIRGRPAGPALRFPAAVQDPRARMAKEDKFALDAIGACSAPDLVPAARWVLAWWCFRGENHILRIGNGGP